MRGALAVLVAFHHEKDAGKKFQNIRGVRSAFCLRLRSLVNGTAIAFQTRPHPARISKLPRSWDYRAASRTWLRSA